MKKKKGTILRWIFGILMILGGFGFFGTSIPQGIFSLLLGVSLLPATWNIIGSYLSFGKKLLPILTPILFFIALGAVSPAQPDRSASPANVLTEAKRQTETETQSEQSAPTESETQPEQTAPTESETQSEQSTPAESETQSEQTAPTESETQSEQTAPTESETQPEQTAPAESESQSEQSAPAESESQSPQTPATEATSQPRPAFPTETEAQSEQTETNAKPENMYTTTSLNIRAKASTDSEILEMLPAGEKVEVLGIDGDWATIAYGDEIAYAAVSYLSKTVPETTPQTSAVGGSGSNFDTYDNAEQQQTTAQYVLNKNTRKFHYPSCRSVKKIAPHNYATSNDTRDALIAQGYSPCGNCHP